MSPLPLVAVRPPAMRLAPRLLAAARVGACRSAGAASSHRAAAAIAAQRRRIQTARDVAVPALVLAPADRQRLEDEYRCAGPELLRRLLAHFKVKNLAQAPISNFLVEAAALGASGSVFFGVNLELSGHPLSATVHAEQFIVANAALHGETALAELVVNASPCGHCRQFLNEVNGAEDLAIHVMEPSGSLQTLSHSQLLPADFGPQHLGRAERFLSPAAASDHGLALVRQPPAAACDLAAAALEAANRAYVPYSGCPAGVALRLDDGRIFSGFCIESVAFNPSLPPLQVSIINAICQGALRSIDQVAEIALVEKAEGKVSFARTTYLGDKTAQLFHAAQS